MREDDEYDDEPATRRENMMQRRLRRARGEELDDPADDFYAEERPRGYARPAYRPPVYGPSGGGCATATLYVVVGAIAALLIVFFFLNRAAGSIGEAIGSAVPDIPDVAQIIATPTPQIISGAAVVRRIQALSQLETAEYTIERVIDVSQGSNIPVIGDFLAGDELLLIAHGDVVAGINLAALGPEDVTVSPDGRTVTVRLPPVQILRFGLDSQQTRVYSRDRGIFAPDNKDLETLARQRAEQEILQAACEDGIMQKATDEAQGAMRQFLGLLDVDEVVVQTAPPGPCAAPASAPAGPAATPAAAPTAPVATPAPAATAAAP